MDVRISRPGCWNTVTMLHMCTKLDEELKMLKLVVWEKNFKDQDQTSRSENCKVWDEQDT